MPLVLVRIDCRLIHGQVTEAWIPFTKADYLVVANDEAAEDFWQRSIMKTAVPPEIDLAIYSVREAADNLNGGAWERRKVILLFGNCLDALRSLKAGLRFDHLNIGNISCAPGRHEVTCSVSLGDSDIEYLRQIHDMGVRIEARRIPFEKSIDLARLTTQSVHA